MVPVARPDRSAQVSRHLLVPHSILKTCQLVLNSSGPGPARKHRGLRGTPHPDPHDEVTALTFASLLPPGGLRLREKHFCHCSCPKEARLLPQTVLLWHLQLPGDVASCAGASRHVTWDRQTLADSHTSVPSCRAPCSVGSRCTFVFRLTKDSTPGSGLFIYFIFF